MVAPECKHMIAPYRERGAAPLVLATLRCQKRSVANRLRDIHLAIVKVRTRYPPWTREMIAFSSEFLFDNGLRLGQLTLEFSRVQIVKLDM